MSARTPCRCSSPHRRSSCSLRRAPFAALVLALLTAGTLSGQDAKAVQQAQAMKSKGAPVETVAAQIARDHRLDAAGTAQVLRAARYDARATAAGLQPAFRLDVAGSAAVLRRAGYDARATAPALVDVYRARNTVVMDVMRRAEFDPRELRFVAAQVLLMSAEELAVQMQGEGATALETGQVLHDAYQMAAAPAGDVLHAARFPGSEIVQAFRLVWGLDVHQALQAMYDMEVEFSSPYSFLQSAGYEVPAPIVDRYRIADYRPGRSAQFIEDEGVVDPAKVVGIAPDPSDGVVEMLLRYRDLDQLTVDFGGAAGEILDRTPHTYQADGSTWQGEWLKVRFRDFESGWFRLERLTRFYSRSAKALAYHVVEPAMIVEPIQGMTVTLGAEPNVGTVSLPSGTFGGVAMEGSTVAFEVPTDQQLGITTDVHDFASNSTTVTTRSVGGDNIEIDIDIGFETAGAEVEGTFLDYVPCWTCGTFRIPQSTCFGINIPCFVSFLGSVGASLGSCLDPQNWEEGQMANGPALPFQADLTNPALEIRIVLAADPATGAFSVKQVVPKFEAGVQLRTNHEDLQLHVIQDYVMGQVNQKLMNALTQMDLGGKVVASLEIARGVFGWGHLRGLYLLGDGRWFLDAEY